MSHGASSSRSPPNEHASPDEAASPDHQDTRKLVQWNTDGFPIGEHKAAFTTEIGKLARTHISPAYESWHNVPEERLQLLIKLLKEKFIFPDERHKWILKRANERWRGWKHTLVKKHIDTKATDVERKRVNPKEVRQEDWEDFVELCSTDGHHISRENGKSARGSSSHSPHTTGRRGAACTAEKMKKENDGCSVTRTMVYIATHTKKDGTAPTPASTQHINEIKRIISEDPTREFSDLDHDPVSLILGRDGRGRVRGLGSGVSKTTIQASGSYRERLESKTKELSRVERKLDEFFKQFGSQTTSSGRVHTSTGSSSRAPQQETSSEPPVQTGMCVLKNFERVTVAIGKVIGSAPGSRVPSLALNVRLDEIMDGSTMVPDGGGVTLSDCTVGEIIVWPAYFVSYLSTD